MLAHVCAAAGTLFVLQKDASPKERLLDAIRSKGTNDQQVQQLIEELQTSSPERRPASSPRSLGRWKLLWSMQVLLLRALLDVPRCSAVPVVTFVLSSKLHNYKCVVAISMLKVAGCNLTAVHH